VQEKHKSAERKRPDHIFGVEKEDGRREPTYGRRDASLRGRVWFQDSYESRGTQPKLRVCKLDVGWHLINLEEAKAKRGEEFATSGGVQESNLHMSIFLRT